MNRGSTVQGPSLTHRLAPRPGVYLGCSRRDTDAARDHNARGIDLLANGRLEEAEQAFRTALDADVFLGPAHNNLGTAYYRQKKLYLAAWEFQYAAKLMPNKAEPKNNLGMVFEAVGKYDDAAKSYEQALALEPDNAEVTGNLARVYVRAGRKDDKTRKLLTDVIMKDARPDWVAWAREKLAMMGQPATGPVPFGEEGQPGPPAPDHE